MFGCDDKPGARIFDECGVCDGDGSTCTVQEGVYTTIVPSGMVYIVSLLTTNPESKGHWSRRDNLSVISQVNSFTHAGSQSAQLLFL